MMVLALAGSFFLALFVFPVEVVLVATALVLILSVFLVIADHRARRRAEDAAAIAAISTPPWPTSKPVITPGSPLAAKGRVPR